MLHVRKFVRDDGVDLSDAQVAQQPIGQQQII